MYRKQTCLLKRYANQVILYSHLLHVDEADKYSALVPCLCVFKPFLVNRENPKQVTKINSLSSVLAVMKGLDLATQQVIVAGNTIVVTHLVLFSFFISLLNTWM